MDLMMKAMERIIHRLSMDDKGQDVNRVRNEPQIINPNFRKPRQPTPQPPQILQREQRNNNDQLRPLFHQNQVDDNDFPNNLKNTSITWETVKKMSLLQKKSMTDLLLTILAKHRKNMMITRNATKMQW